jgi:dephospho-CoA kinase
MSHCIGLTGNLASGKTSVATLFMQKGIDVFSADAIAKEITTIGTSALSSIHEHFGNAVMLPSGQLNRNALRMIIFSNKTEKLWLEKLLHPIIRETLEQKVSGAASPYCIIEIPLLLDKTDYPYLNRILLVTSNETLQIDRVMKRDQCSREHALAILATQPKIDVRIKFADDVLHNDAGLDQLSRQVDGLHARYLALAQVGRSI